MEEMLLKMVSPNEDNREGLYVSCVYDRVNGREVWRAWPNTGRPVSQALASSQSLTDGWGGLCGLNCTAFLWGWKFRRGWESYSWYLWEMLDLVCAFRGPPLSCFLRVCHRLSGSALWWDEQEKLRAALRPLWAWGPTPQPGKQTNRNKMCWHPT